MNRLQSYVKTVGGPTVADFSYTFAPTGERFSKRDNLAATEEAYMYDSADVVADYSKTGTAYTLLRSYLQMLSIDSKVARVDATGEAFYYVGDALGSVNQVLRQDQTVANSTLVNAWGEDQVFSQAVSDRHGFTQRERDGESNLMHFRARSYDASSGRFISKDPAKFFPMVNPYSYASSNPIMRSDPLGLIDEETSNFLRFLAKNSPERSIRHFADHLLFAETEKARAEQGKRTMLGSGSKAADQWWESLDYSSKKLKDLLNASNTIYEKAFEKELESNDYFRRVLIHQKAVSLFSVSSANPAVLTDNEALAKLADWTLTKFRGKYFGYINNDEESFVEDLGYVLTEVGENWTGLWLRARDDWRELQIPGGLAYDTGFKTWFRDGTNQVRHFWIAVWAGFQLLRFAQTPITVSEWNQDFDRWLGLAGVDLGAQLAGLGVALGEVPGWIRSKVGDPLETTPPVPRTRAAKGSPWSDLIWPDSILRRSGVR
jgi:RHS repeat-associated protein